MAEEQKPSKPNQLPRDHASEITSLKDQVANGNQVSEEALEALSNSLDGAQARLAGSRGGAGNDTVTDTGDGDDTDEDTGEGGAGDDTAA